MSEEQIEIIVKDIIKDIIKENINSGIDVYDIEKLNNIDTDPIIDDKNDIVEVKEWSPIQDDNSSTDSIKKVKQKKEVKTFKQRCEDDPIFYQKTKDRLKEKVTCDICRSEISKSSLSEHRLTKRHLRNVEHENNNIQIKKVNKLLELMEQLTTINKNDSNDDIIDDIKQEIPKNKSKPTSKANAEKARQGKLKKK